MGEKSEIPIIEQITNITHGQRVISSVIIVNMLYPQLVNSGFDNLIKAQQEEKQAAQQNANAQKDTTKKVQKR